MNGEGGGGGCSIGVGGEEKNLVLDAGDESAAFGDGGDEQRGLADGDGFAASFSVGGGVLDSSFDEGAGGALAERAAGEVAGEFQVEAIRSVVIGLAGGGGGLEDGDVHAGGLDGDVGVVHRLAEEVVGADGAGHVVAGPVVALGFAVLLGELDIDLELGQHIVLDVESDFGGR